MDEFIISNGGLLSIHLTMRAIQLFDSNSHYIPKIAIINKKNSILIMIYAFIFTKRAYTMLILNIIVF
jgi:hypothetical protein